MERNPPDGKCQMLSLVDEPDDGAAAGSNLVSTGLRSGSAPFPPRKPSPGAITSHASVSYWPPSRPGPPWLRRCHATRAPSASLRRPHRRADPASVTASPAPSSQQIHGAKTAQTFCAGRAMGTSPRGLGRCSEVGSWVLPGVLKGRTKLVVEGGSWLSY